MFSFFVEFKRKSNKCNSRVWRNL